MSLEQPLVPAVEDLFREYEPPFMPDGYPYAWSHETVIDGVTVPAIKDLVREQAGNRCVRCGHPYTKGQHGNGEWSPCDRQCAHAGPRRSRIDGDPWELEEERGLLPRPQFWADDVEVEAQWRILTVHHLDGNKANCRWWNLVSLCQRCHLTIQGKVKMDHPYDRAHSNWFIPYVCGFYASKYLSQDISRAEADQRQDELLALELRQFPLFNADLT